MIIKKIGDIRLSGPVCGIVDCGIVDCRIVDCRIAKCGVRSVECGVRSAECGVRKTRRAEPQVTNSFSGVKNEF